MADARESIDGARGAWFWPALLALGVGGGLAFAAAWVRLPEAPASFAGPVQAAPELVVTRFRALPAGEETRERLRLLDPSPLFLPAGVGSEAAGTVPRVEQRQGGAVGAGVPPALAFPDQAPARDILRPRNPNTGLEAEKWGATDRWFAGMSRTDEYARSPAASANPGGVLEVFIASDLRRVAKIELPADPVLSASSWRPMELRVLVDAAGPVSAPVVIRGSGVDEVDAVVREAVSKDLLPGLRLRPGAYRLIAGP